MIIITLLGTSFSLLQILGIIIYIFYNNSEKNNDLRFVDSDNNQLLRIYHQSIFGLGSKTNDLLISLYP